MSTNSPGKVAIFGNGPSALVAAHAASQLGCTVHFFGDRMVPSPLYGCQYLHRPIPGLYDVQKTRVRYELRGTAEEYREKVYGDNWRANVSPEDLDAEHDAWDLRETYAFLWKHYIEYGDSWSRLKIDGRTFVPGGKYPEYFQQHYTLCISTIPARSLCAGKGHTFSEQEVYASGDAPDLGITVPVPAPADTIVCNGAAEPAWYRASRVFGHATVEWPGRRKPPFDGVVRVTKPLWTNCDCAPWLHRLGRYGAWRKGVLVHDVYEQTLLLVRSRTSGTPILKPQDIRPDFCTECCSIATQRRTGVDGIQYSCLRGHNWKAI